MDQADASRLGILIVLFGFSAFFSSSETALTAVNRVRIRTLAAEGHRRAIVVEKLLDDRQRLLSSLLIGNNIINTALTAFATLTVTELFGSFFVGAATAVLTVLLLIFGEITPKNYAAKKAEKLSLLVARPIYCWMILITPVSCVLDLIVGLLLRLLRADKEHKDSYTETEIRTIVDESHEDGEIETEERRMINNVFDLDESTARDVMTPRVDMVFLSVDADYEETVSIYRENLFTRMPVYEGDSYNVVGIFNVKDILKNDSDAPFSVRSLMREAHFTHEFKRVSELMKEMLSEGIHMSVVLDEYGDTAGLVTMEDLLEEIVGDIRDEYDDPEEDQIRELSDGVYLVDGSADFDDINEAVPGLRLESDDFDSVGGIVIGLLDRLPVDGDEVVTEDGVRLRVAGMESNHIDKVLLTVPERTEETADTGDEREEED